MVQRKRKAIAIDGPAGAGKGDVSRLLAAMLGFRLLDTGAIYRAVAWLAQHGEVSLGDPLAVDYLADYCEENLVFVDGVLFWRDRRSVESLDIRNPAISDLASQVSALPRVREAVLELQRSCLDDEVGLVAEGRDMASTVFPNAKLKIYLDARPEVRAGRRHQQNLKKGIKTPFDKVLEDINRRDHRDKTRQDSPLVCVSDAIVIDTGPWTAQQVAEQIKVLWYERQAA